MVVGGGGIQYPLCGREMRGYSSGIGMIYFIISYYTIIKYNIYSARYGEQNTRNNLTTMDNVGGGSYYNHKYIDTYFYKLY